MIIKGLEDQKSPSDRINVSGLKRGMLIYLLMKLIDYFPELK
jgi:hypothetical protein